MLEDMFSHHPLTYDMENTGFCGRGKLECMEKGVSVSCSMSGFTNPRYTNA